MREERRTRAHMRDRLSDGPPPPSNGLDFEDEEGRRRRAAAEERRRNGQNKEDDELRRAIEESKRMAQEEQERIRRDAKDEEELQRALALSKEEEEKRIREIERRNENALFDDDFNLQDGPPNQYAQQQQVDMWGNPIYGMQPQYTSVNPYLQQQQTSFNPFFQQQMALQAQQQAEYERQMELQAAAQQYQHLMTQPQMPPQQPLQPQPTAFGSNNPFAFAQNNHQQQQQQQPPRQPALDMQAPLPSSSSVPTGDLLGGEEDNTRPSTQSTQPTAAQNRFTNDPRFKELDRMLATGDGIDTFGNTGDLRFGHSQARVQAVQNQQTGAPQGGNNPFFKT